MIGFQLFPALPILFVLGCIFLVAFLDGWALPATRAMLPRLVKEKELVKANSFISIMTETTQLGGWAFGGMLTAFIGGQQVVGLTFILFFIATIIMCLITDKTAPQLNQQHTSKMGELKEGWILIWRTPIFRSIHIMIVLESIATVVWVAAILYIFTAEILHVDESWWGYINTCFFTGLIIGG